MSVLSSIQKMFPPPHVMAFPCVGVDVSDTSLKYIQFEKVHHASSGADLRVEHWGDIDVPAGVVERGSVNDVEKLTAVLCEMKDRTGAQYVRMSLPEERAYLFETTIDIDTPKKEIRGYLEFKLEENVPLSPGDAYFDYEIIGVDETKKAYMVIVAVYAKTTINNYYEACKGAGLTPLSFEIEAQAILRAVVPQVNEGAYMLIDFGKTRMGVGIVYNGSLMYTSTLEVAGHQMSQEMREVLGNVAESELTEIKNTRGLSKTKENEAIAEILLKYAENIADELSVRIHYWHSRGIDRDERAIKKVILCGGSSNLFGLPEFLTQRLEVPTERAKVWTNAFSLDEYIPEITRRYSYGYATAIGLAVKNFLKS